VHKVGAAGDGRRSLRLNPEQLATANSISGKLHHSTPFLDGIRGLR
jgi:hypothetical protein